MDSMRVDAVERDIKNLSERVGEEDDNNSCDGRDDVCHGKEGGNDNLASTRAMSVQSSPRTVVLANSDRAPQLKRAVVCSVYLADHNYFDDTSNGTAFGAEAALFSQLVANDSTSGYSGARVVDLVLRFVPLDHVLYYGLKRVSKAFAQAFRRALTASADYMTRCDLCGTTTKCGEKCGVEGCRGHARLETVRRLFAAHCYDPESQVVRALRDAGTADQLPVVVTEVTRIDAPPRCSGGPGELDGERASERLCHALGRRLPVYSPCFRESRREARGGSLVADTATADGGQVGFACFGPGSDGGVVGQQQGARREDEEEKERRWRGACLEYRGDDDRRLYECDQPTVCRACAERAAWDEWRDDPGRAVGSPLLREAMRIRGSMRQTKAVVLTCDLARSLRELEPRDGCNGDACLHPDLWRGLQPQLYSPALHACAVKEAMLQRDSRSLLRKLELRYGMVVNRAAVAKHIMAHLVGRVGQQRAEEAVERTAVRDALEAAAGRPPPPLLPPQPQLLPNGTWAWGRPPLRNTAVPADLPPPPERDLFLLGGGGGGGGGGDGGDGSSGGGGGGSSCGGGSGGGGGGEPHLPVALGLVPRRVQLSVGPCPATGFEHETADLQCMVGPCDARDAASALGLLQNADARVTEAECARPDFCDGRVGCDCGERHLDDDHRLFNTGQRLLPQPSDEWRLPSRAEVERDFDASALALAAQDEPGGAPGGGHAERAPTSARTQCPRAGLDRVSVVPFFDEEHRGICFGDYTLYRGYKRWDGEGKRRRDECYRVLDDISAFTSVVRRNNVHSDARVYGPGVRRGESTEFALNSCMFALRVADEHRLDHLRVRCASLDELTEAMRVPYVTGPRVAVLLGTAIKGLAP